MLKEESLKIWIVLKNKKVNKTNFIYQIYWQKHKKMIIIIKNICLKLRNNRNKNLILFKK